MSESAHGDTSVDVPGAPRTFASHERPAQFTDISSSDLSVGLRLLLFHDGTLTAALETHQLAPVVADVTEQREVRLDETRARWLGAAVGAPAIRRRAGLRNQRTWQLLVEAESLLLPARLPLDFTATLANSPQGLGEALGRLELERRRELLWYGRAAAPDTARPDHGLLARCYRLIVGGQPVCCVEERFLTRRLTEDSVL